MVPVSGGEKSLRRSAEQIARRSTSIDAGGFLGTGGVLKSGGVLRTALEQNLGVGMEAMGASHIFRFAGLSDDKTFGVDGLGFFGY